MHKFGKMVLCCWSALVFAFPVMSNATSRDAGEEDQYRSFVETDSPFSTELAGIEVDPYTGNTITDEC